MALSPVHLVGSSITEEREKQDFYATPESATQSLLDRESFPGLVWEPACGDGAISKLLSGTSITVISTDLFDRGYGVSGVDFLMTSTAVDHVITNPPYRLAQQFVEHALEVTKYKVAMLLKLNFLEGQKRKPFLQKSPLRVVYVFSKRLSFDKGYEKSKGSGVLAYAWYVWDKSYNGKPQIDWI